MAPSPHNRNAFPNCEQDPNKPCTVADKVADIHTALLGTLENPNGLVNQVRQHGETLYGKDGKGGLVRDFEDVKTVKTISRAVWIAGGVLLAVFGQSLGSWMWEHLLGKVAGK